MTCKDVNGLLDRLMDGELTEDEHRELEAHGQTCPDCAAEIRATLEMKALFEETLPEADVPLAAQAKWRGAIRQEARKSRQRRLTRWIGSAAAAVVVLVGVGVALNGSMAPKQDAAPKPAVVQEAAEEAEASEADVAYEAQAVDAGEVNIAEAADEAPVVETDGERSLMSAGEAPVAGFSMKSALADVMGEAEEAAEPAPEAFEAEDAEEADAAEPQAEEFEDAALGEAPMCAALAQQSPACEYAIQARDVKVACGVIGDLAGEFEAAADVQDVEGGSANVYVELDAASANEFLAAVAKLDDAPTPADVPEVSGEGTVLVLLVVQPLEK